MTKNIIKLIKYYPMMFRVIICALALVTILSSGLQINQASATTCTQTAGFTQSQIVMSPSGAIIVNPSDIVVNHADWVEFCGNVPAGMIPFSSVTVGTSSPFVFTMTQDSSTGMWYTPTIMFSNSQSCTPSVASMTLCANTGTTANVAIIFKDPTNTNPDIPGPVGIPAQVTDGGEGISISTYTKPSLFDNQLIACSANPRAPGGAQGIDTDKDGLCDSWEKNGSIEIKDSRITGSYVFTCEPGTCKTNKKDLFVEIDYMQGHKPSQMEINHIRDAFASAPVPGGAGIDPGIDVHIILDEAVPHKRCTSFPGDNTAPGFDQIKSNFYGTSNERAQVVSGFTGNNWFHDQGWKLKRYAFHYVLMVDLQCGSESSGIAEQWGNDAMISLGSASSIDQQEGTILHELGHNLSLDHGGGDAVNCKPNELSVMSYTRQFSDMVSDRKLDFSRTAVGSTAATPPSLDESNLVDADGLSSYGATQENTLYGPYGYSATTGRSPVDWDHQPSTPTAQMDLNRVTDGNTILCDGSNGVAGQTKLLGYNEWSILKFDGRGSSNTFDGRPQASTAAVASARTTGSQHSDYCIATNSIPEKIKKTVQENYRVCTAGRALTAEESTWANVKYTVDSLNETATKTSGIRQVSEIKSLVNDTNTLLEKGDVTSAMDKISNFKKTYDGKINPDIYQLDSASTTIEPEDSELTPDNVNTMRKIRLNAIEDIISKNTKNDDYSKQYIDAFQKIRNFIDDKDMNSAIYATLDVRKTYDDAVKDNLILTDKASEETRQMLLQTTDDVLRSFGKAVNDPEIKSFYNNPKTTITFTKQIESPPIPGWAVAVAIIVIAVAIGVGIRTIRTSGKPGEQAGTQGKPGGTSGVQAGLSKEK